MKILAIQIARLGDIFQTWPALRALKRAYPQAEIHVLTRGRYQAAFDGLEVVVQRKILPSQDIVAPLLEPTMDVKTAHQITAQFCDSLKNENYDWILNFSFSPLSSFITHAVSHENTKVSGYTRTSDGFLAIPDDMSAYFYAQVGIDRPNRFHLAEIFSTMVGSDLIAQDWSQPAALPSYTEIVPEILLHVGASEIKKQISPMKWMTILRQFIRLMPDAKIGLIGAAQESDLAEKIMSSTSSENVVNMVGKTSLQQLFAVIQKAKVVMGGDSAPMHMASLVGVPCLNLSLSSVNFWETGPRAAGSCILRGIDETDFASDQVASVLTKMLQGAKQDLSVIQVQANQSTQNGGPAYRALMPKTAEFEWNLLKALYQSEDFPETEDANFREAIFKLADVNLLMIEQMQTMQKGTQSPQLAEIIDRGEEVIQTIGQLVPLVSPIVRWYQTEKIRIGPDTHENLLTRSLEIQNLFQRLLNLYVDHYATKEQINQKNETTTS